MAGVREWGQFIIAGGVGDMFGGKLDQG
jgi:hypothetical protein